MITKDGIDYVNPKEAAALWGIARSGVYARIQDKLVEPLDVDGRKYIDMPTIKRLQDNPPKVGRKPRPKAAKKSKS